MSSLQNAIGVAVSADLSSAYVTEQTSTGKGTLTRYDLTSSNSTLLYTSATAPLFFLTWADPSESALLVTERDPANQVWRVDLTTSPVTVASLATGVPARPSSVAITSPTNLLICSDSEISDLDLTGGAFGPSGPVFLGIGLVPITSIKNSSPINPLTDGFATTAPGYYLQVKDSPFGSSLTLMINHAGVYAAPLHARYYQLLVDGSQPLQSFDDYLWNGTTFVLQPTSPLSGGFYPVRPPTQLWYNPTLGYVLDTSKWSHGIHEISVKLFNAGKLPITVPPTTIESRWVQIDNGWPTAAIEQVLHSGTPVGACAMVTYRSGCVHLRHHCRRPGTASAELELDRLVGRQQVEGRGLRHLQQPPSRAAVGGHYQYRRASCGRTAPFGGALGCGCVRRSDVHAMCPHLLSGRVGPDH